MTTTSQSLLSPQSDKDLKASDPPLIRKSEIPAKGPESVAKPEIVEKWKKKFTLGLRSESAKQTA